MRGDQLERGSLIGGYRIDEVISRGGMGVVYRATSVALRRIYAVKVLAPELSDDVNFRDRFKREMRIAASLNHPNVVGIHYAGEHEGMLFLVMDYVYGTDLRQILLKTGALDPDRAVDLLMQFAVALDSAHAKGLVHRDVKPANMLITVRDGEEHGYLTDFGLAKRSDNVGALTSKGVVVGTVDYMAPEQITGNPTDARTDIYALGCVFFEMLSGKVPYERENSVATLFAHVHEPPPALPESLGALYPTFGEVIEKAMTKDPGGRYLSPGDFARDAAAALEGTRYTGSPTIVAVGEARPTGSGVPAVEQARTDADAAPPPLAPTARAQPETPAPASEGTQVPSATEPVAQVPPPTTVPPDTRGSEWPQPPLTTVPPATQGPPEPPPTTVPPATQGPPEPPPTTVPPATQGPPEPPPTTVPPATQWPPEPPPTTVPAATQGSAQPDSLSVVIPPVPQGGGSPPPPTSVAPGTEGGGWPEPLPATVPPRTVQGVPAGATALTGGEGAGPGGPPGPPMPPRGDGADAGRIRRRRWLAGGGVLVAAAVIAAIILLVLPGPSPVKAGQTYAANVRPVPTNRVTGVGNATVLLQGNVATVTVATIGLFNGVHLMHIHGGTGNCPPATAAQAFNGHQFISASTGDKFYGGVVTSLTTHGDTTPAVHLVTSLYPAVGNIRYTRTFTLGPGVAAEVRQGLAVIVVHGTNYDGKSTYDNFLGPGGEPGAPALCGALFPAQTASAGTQGSGTIYVASMHALGASPTEPSSRFGLLCHLAFAAAGVPPTDAASRAPGPA